MVLSDRRHQVPLGASLSWSHPLAQDAGPVLVFDKSGFGVTPREAALMNLQLLSASARERAALQRAGYVIPDAERTS